MFSVESPNLIELSFSLPELWAKNLKGGVKHPPGQDRVKLHGGIWGWSYPHQFEPWLWKMLKDAKLEPFRFWKRTSNGTKVRFKNLCTKFWDRCCYSTMYQIFLLQIAFQSSHRVKLDFWGSVIKVASDFRSRGTEKIELSSQGPTAFKFCEMKLLLLLITNMQKIFKFAMLDIKL